MNAASEAGPARDFSDVAIWRGSAVAVAVGCMLSVIVPRVWMQIGANPFDLAQAFFVLSYSFQFVFNPAALVLGICAMLIMVVISYFVMAAYKGDHTTHRAAMIIGARTAAIGIAISLFFSVMFSRGGVLTNYASDASGVLTGLAQVAVVCALSLAIGAITGLAARIAAGAPTIEIRNEAA